VSDLDINSYGFTWGPLKVTRVADFEPRMGRRLVVLGASTDHHTVEICVSATGRSVRVFRDNKELT